MAPVQGDADLERDTHRAAGPLDLSQAGRAVLGGRLPGLGSWTNKRWWKLSPPSDKDGVAPSNIGNTGAAAKVDPVIAAQEFPGFASVSMPGVLRIVYPKFIHYEFYVPIDADRHRYVGVMVNFLRGPETLKFYVKYLGWVRWLFHGQFSGQDAWMVDVTDAPPSSCTGRTCP